jgi:hypothetical protein
MTYQISQVFSYSFPTSSLEYVKNYNFSNNTVSILPLTASNLDSSIPITIVVSSSKPWIQATVLNSTTPGFSQAYPLTGEYSRPAVIPPNGSLNIAIRVDTPTEIDVLSNAQIFESIQIRMLSGSGSSETINKFVTQSNVNDRIEVNYTYLINSYYPRPNIPRAITSVDDFAVLGTFTEIDRVASKIVYTRGQLLEKKRKIEIILDNFSQPICGYQSVYSRDFYGVCADKNFGDDAERANDKVMLSNKWNFSQQDFPNIASNIRNNWAPEYIYTGGSTYGDTVKILKQTLRDALCIYEGQDSDVIPKGGNVYNFFNFSVNDLDTKSFEEILKYVKNILQDYLNIINNLLLASGTSFGLGNTVQPNPNENYYIATKLNEPYENTVTVPLRINITTLEVPLLAAIMTSSMQVLAEKMITFMDVSKEYKTLLNFGDDTQYVAESWRISPSSTSSIQLKLFTPVNENVQLYDRAFISREVAKTVVDNIEFELSEEIDFSPSLRPRNTAVDKYIPNKKSINRVTLNSLNLTGSVGTTAATAGVPISYEDTVFRKWYTSNFNSSELNIDFSDYTNFVSFGSAKSRIDAFVNKLTEIEDLTRSITGNVVGDALKAQEKESIIRAFDPYEQYLYYTTASIYSASVYYTETGIEYNPTGSWPKSGSILLPVTSSVAVAWYATQSAIAERFDENNQNNLTRHLPLHIQENEESTDFLTFIKMFGHVVDNLKVYVDQFPNIYSNNPDPFEELTMDQVYEVATSFGLKLPNVYSLETLQQYVAETYGGIDGRSTVAETWKRFLHMMIYLYKTKGSKTSLEAVLAGYGIQSPALQIKETSYPSANTFITSDELTYGLLFTSASVSYVEIPNVSSSFTTNTLSVRFIPTGKVSSSLLTGDDKWSINLVPHPSASTVSVVEDYGRIEIVSGSSRVLVASSSYFPLFGEDYTTITLRSQSADFTIIQSDGDQLLYQYSASNNIPNTLWNSTLNVYVGGSGSIKTNTHFDGIVDEVRSWNENITKDNIIKQSYDPGEYYGNTYSSSYNNLYVSLAFSQPSSSITASAINESPYYGAVVISTVPTYGFVTSSYQRIQRTVKQYVPSVGATVYSNNKVIVADPPVFDSKFVDANGTKTLSPKTSIKSLDQKKYVGGLNVVSFAVSPTDFINQNIVRTMGNVDVNNLIGNPRDLKDGKYDELNKLFKYYKTNYNKAINPNEYIDFYKNLAEAPAEISRTLNPARSKLLTGIVIESPFLSRTKFNLNKSVEIGGSNTKALNNFISGSGSVQDVGVFSTEVIYDMKQNTTVLADITPLSGSISTTPTSPSSSYLYFEASTINAQITASISGGYPRYAFSDEIINTPEQPFYEIPPRSDLLEYGTTSYFHKTDSIYPFQVLTPYKQKFLAILDIKPFWSISPVYAKITLLPTGSLLTVPGRDSVEFGSQTYLAGATVDGFVNSATVFSLIGIDGEAGLRVRLYRNATYRSADPVSRPLSSPPTGDHGVLFDGLLEDISDVMPFLLIQTENATTYFRITNTTGSDITANIRLNYFAYEVEPLVPQGYLPRHYRFTRDNTTPLKRRNYVGCRASIGDNITDPVGRVGNSNPFYTITSDYNSIDVINKPTNTGTTTTQTPTGGRTPPRLRLR